jgi:hypothetical protein
VGGIPEEVDRIGEQRRGLGLSGGGRLDEEHLRVGEEGDPQHSPEAAVARGRCGAPALAAIGHGEASSSCQDALNTLERLQGQAGETPMQIGDLAKLTETPVDTIRYCEKIGLLQRPARTAGDYRLYSSREVGRLRFVRRCRRLDLSVGEIKQLARELRQLRAVCRAPGKAGNCRILQALRT